MAEQDNAHHAAWLAAHPERSREWLKARLKDGFDVHHIDGDRENNDPLNLVLIEAGDHMMLHNGSARFLRMSIQDRRNYNRAVRAKGTRYGVSEETIARWRSESRLVANG